jgi:transposase
MERRIVGIDLGIASEHTVRVLNGEGQTLAKRRAVPSAESLGALEAVALQGAPEGIVLEVVMEATGPAWFPVAVFFSRRGHRVFRVSSQKSADLRRFLQRHAKSNAIDADTLARLAIIAPEHLRPLELPGAERATLDRRVRATDRFTQQASKHKVRIKDLVRQLLPMTPLRGDLGQADLAVLERFADPRVLLHAGRGRLTKVIATASNHQLGEERAEQWREAALASIELYQDQPCVPFADLAAEVESEVRVLRSIEAEIAKHAAVREQAYRSVDPAGLARSVPGLGAIGAPALVATMGDPGRFRNAAAFRSFTGLAPKASETGNTDRKGQQMSKAGSSLLRTTLVRAADHARREDPELARIYFTQLTLRGKNHLGALCVVAAELAERSFVVMRRNSPYVLRDLTGQPITPEQAKQLIAEQLTVSEEVRARRRSRKVGKAPQSGALGASARGTKSRPEGSDTKRRPSPLITPQQKSSPVKQSA